MSTGIGYIGQMLVGSTPTSPTHVIRATDVQSVVFGSASVEPNDTGTYECSIDEIAPIQKLYLKPAAGLSGAYTYTINLNETNRSEHDLIIFFVEPASSTDPTIDFVDNASGSTLVQMKFDGNGTKCWLTFIFDGSNWVASGYDPVDIA